MNGKKYAWQGVALLPFVDEDRMMKALNRVYPDLTEEESKWQMAGVVVRCFTEQFRRLCLYLSLDQGQADLRCGPAYERSMWHLHLKEVECSTQQL